MAANPISAAVMRAAKSPIHLGGPRVFYQGPRPMMPLDVLPAELTQGFENVTIDPNWAWVYSTPSGIKALILVAGAHNLAFVIRMVATADFPKLHLRELMRNTLRDLAGRGYKGVMVGLDWERPTEAKLIRVLINMGFLVAGKLMLLGNKL